MHDEDENELLTARFEEHRNHLRAVAFRILGSLSEADDAVQETWLRLSRSGADEVENLGGWLTTVIGRICLDILRTRASRREEPLDTYVPGPADSRADPLGPEHEALLADAVSSALLVVLDTLTPAERLAFVLHDLFAVPFTEVAPVLERTPAAARQLASRARRRVRDAPTATDADPGRRREIVAAFLAATRDGDFDALLALLDPDVVVRADRAAMKAGAAGEVRGAAAVARTILGRARALRPALVNGTACAVAAPGGQPRVVFGFTITDGRITGIDLRAAPEWLGGLDVTILAD
ncbi:putative RNA polymerase sigma factor [Streptomyces sp. L-9-10]|uniref:sigma-70 family RNA polymerase sigma factor n=1 Tax=Streptomyces sp. L-9-10 TaxID=1478131 RepID=UPI00101C29C9|nr:sigma-70 family RNA polymerase sigma factor [Streptomyces sp. L-9-10]RYJ29747.1 putative RNA polymerase sigma factor [Streptomyces sp. L-9-10]